MAFRNLALCGIATLALGAGQRTASVVRAIQRPGPCLPSNGFRQFVEHVIADTTPVGPKVRPTGMSRMDRAAAIQVQSDSLCRRAIRVINDDVHTNGRERSVFLMRAGAYFFAQDSSIRAGEYGVVFVIDSSMSKVIKRIFD